MAVTDYKGITIELRGETTDLQKKLAQIRESAKTTFSGLREVNKNLRFDSSSIVDLTQKQKYLKDAIKATADRASAYDAALRALDDEAKKNGGLTEKQQAQYDQLERSIEQCKRQIDQYCDELQRANTDIDNHSSKLWQFGQKAEDVGGKLKSAGGAMASVGDNLTRYVTVPLTAGAGVAIRAATDLDTSYHNLTKTVDGSDEELQKFKDNAVELSKVQPVPATTILDVEALGAQLGFSNENLESFAKTVTGLDIATDMDAETAAMELAHFANIMGMSEKDTDRYGSTIVSLGNHFATTESDISSMALRIAGAGNQIGMSEADVLGLATALTSMGINAEAGGTAISTVMSQIDKDVANGTEGVKQWADTAGMSVDEFMAHVSKGDDWAKEFAKNNGMTLKELQKTTQGSIDNIKTWADTAKMSSEDFAKAWHEDPVKALEAVFKGMESACEEGENMNIMLDDLGISSIRQTDMMKRLASNSGLVGNAVKDANTAWKDNTALSKEVENRNESLASKFEVLKNRAKAVAAQVGEPLADALLDALEAAKPLIKMVEDGAKAFSKMDKAQQQDIIRMAAFVAAVGPLLAILGRTVIHVGDVVEKLGEGATAISTFKSSMKQGVGVVASLNTAVEGLGSALSVGVFAIGIAAAVAAVSAFIGYLANWHAENERTKKSHEDFAKSIGNLSEAVHGAKPDVESSADAIKKVGDQANFTRDDLEALTDAQNRLADTIKQRNAETEQSVDALEKAKGIIEAYTGQTGLGADEQARLRDAIETVNDKCGTTYEVFDAANGKIREQGDDAEVSADKLSKLIDKQIEQTKTNALLANMEDVYKNYYDQLDKLNTIETDIKETEEQRNEALRLLNEEQEKSAGHSATHAAEVAEYNKHLGELKESYDQVRDSVDSSVEHLDFYDQELSRISDSSDNTKTALESLVDGTAALHAKLQDTEDIQTFAQQLSDLGISVQDYAGLSYTELQKLADNYDGTTKSIADTLKQFGDDAKSTAKDAGDGIRDNVMGPMNQMPGEVQSTADNTRANLYDVLSQMPGDAQSTADNTGSTLRDTLESYSGQVGDSATSIKDAANDGVSSLPDDFSSTGDAAGTNIATSLGDAMNSNEPHVSSAADNLANAQHNADVSGEAGGWGREVGSNIAGGLWDAVSWVSDAANAVADVIYNVLGHSVPKEGPLREGGKGEFVWGQHLVQNVIGGVEAEKPALARAMEDLAKETESSFVPQLDASVLVPGASHALYGSQSTLAADVVRTSVQGQSVAPLVLNVTFDRPVIRDEVDMNVLVRKLETKVRQIERSRL